jgi:hypothetical protein
MEAVRRSNPLSLTLNITCTCLALLGSSGHGQDVGGSTRERHLKEQSHFASMFKAGDTNAPLLAMDWFSDHGVYFCRVSQSGNVYSARDAGHAIQGGGGVSSRFSPGTTNRLLLEAAINALPASSIKSLREERQILVSGIRSNQWIERVYDRANIPAEVEKLYELTAAYLGWFIPKVDGRKLARLHDSNFSGRFATVAGDADLAVSLGQWITNGAYHYPPVMEFWTLKNGLTEAVPPFKGIPQTPSEWHGFVASPDGTAVAVATIDGLYVIDGRTGKLRWQAGPLDHDNYYGTTLAVGDKGRALYSSGAHIVERWDLCSGRKLATLCTNELIVKFLRASRDGSMLLAGFGSFNASATSFTLWEAGKDEPVLRFSSPNSAAVAMSTDGHTLLLSHWGEKKLDLWNWKKEERVQVPLRGPYASGSASSLHWSPDGKRLAAYLDTYPSSIVIYETKNWKPLAQWCCRQFRGSSQFVVKPDGNLLQLSGGQINGLDLTAIHSVAE